MGLFDFLKKDKEEKGKQLKSYIYTDMNATQIADLVNQAITVFQYYPDASQKELVDKIKFYSKGDEKLAMAMYRFIPVAFCRIQYPDARYSDTYTIFRSANEYAEYSFREDDIYNIVYKESEKRYAYSNKDVIDNILEYSSSYAVIQQILEKGENPGDYDMSPVIFPDTDNIK